ncbi:error-prone DNA polymerase [Marinobacterium mangrovicola]|uniref:Error-prone DNA polymerase n=1 Tax=Marinobacterium mangrovicola TaxID=1476959 RepID=A0A4R1G3W0_9GAMM|nr:error-prone DNA polymerase [Marinobacterium mangrovicola]TCK02364.1 error-prone DNA polymerase [Marinobacterium mangrovicola]
MVISASESGYAELHAISNFSFLRGASHPEELVAQAALLGYRALALTDECSVAGVVRAHQEAKELGIKLLIGSEFRIDGRVLVLLARDRSGYAQLCSLITTGRRRAKKGEYSLTLEDFETGLDRCLLLFQPGTDRALLESDLQWLQRHHPEHSWLLLERLLDSDDSWRYQRLLEVAEQYQLPRVCAGDVRMHEPGRQPLQDLLTAIRLRTTVMKAGWQLGANAERHLRPLDALAQLYSQSLREQTLKIASLCEFSLDELRYEYPAELVPPGLTPQIHLRNLTEAGVKRRFPQGEPEKVRQLIEHELRVIAELRYEPYFLTIEDIVRFARDNDILCQGRGSAANSVVCYCLGITEVDPRQVNLLFERFLSKERNEPPDIDVDFEHQRREEVIQYIYSRYGRERAGLAAAVISYRSRSAIRDVGRALGFDEAYLGWLISQLDRRDTEQPWLEQLRTLGGKKPALAFRQLLALVPQILHFPRHLSQHVGGFVISSGPLHQLVPVENAAMQDRTLIQWNKDDLEALGLLKIDILALGMLSALRRTLHLLGERDQHPWQMQDIPREDPQVYAMLSEADSMGVFQVESRAQMNMLPRLKPARYYDLVVQVAIVRPGPIQGDMVHPYLLRRQGKERVDYPSDEVREVLSPTLGVPIFQEQVIRLAMVAAGFSAGEADQLRRAMAAWRRSGTIAVYQQKLREGMTARGYSAEFAERICRQIEGFGEYGFPESHAASFALLAYLSAWLKYHEPAAFCCALLNSQPMGFYSPSQLVQDAIGHGVKVRPVCINASAYDCALEYEAGAARRGTQGVLRLGLRLVKGLSREGAERLVAARPTEGFTSVSDLRSRARLSRGDQDALAAANALAAVAGHRHQVRWELLREEIELALDDQPAETDHSRAYEPVVQMPAPDECAEMEADYRHLGLTLGRHPMALLREQSRLPRVVPSNRLDSIESGRPVRVAGLVTNRQRPGTATGITFVTLEDEFGQINLVVWQATARAQRKALLGSRILQVDGILEREGSLIHVIAGRLTDLSAEWEGLQTRSRDFH